MLRETVLIVCALVQMVNMRNTIQYKVEFNGHTHTVLFRHSSFYRVVTAYT